MTLENISKKIELNKNTEVALVEKSKGTNFEETLMLNNEAKSV